jgi:hypothetical protein
VPLRRFIDALAERRRVDRPADSLPQTVRGFARWLFGDIAAIVAPRVDRGPRGTPTRRAARWLIGIGLFVTLFGALGVAAETETVLEKQPATVLGRYTTFLRHTGGGSTLHKVRLPLADGTTKSIPHAPLYDAVGTRTDVPVTVEIDPDTDLIDAVFLEGHRYGTGRQSAAVVVTILITALGAFILLRGVGRRRRARLFERSSGGAALQG